MSGEITSITRKNKEARSVMGVRTEGQTLGIQTKQAVKKYSISKLLGNGIHLL